MKLFAFFFLIFIVGLLTAQTGDIRGVVIDQESKIPLIGADIELLNGQPATGAITDFNGRFTLTEVPLGRQRIRISYIGYESHIISNLNVTTGKAVAVKVGLTESFEKLNEAVVTSSTGQNDPVNKMATVSARQFGIEEVARFSGGRNDIGRLAANFAGVSSPDDSRNDIVIRGNSPSGLLWRLEGVPISSPNHFAVAGTTGGPISAMNPNMLENSDFLTSAFPAEYGNAIGGVFDLGFREGNTDDYEYAVLTTVFSGLEATAEGPLGEKGGSFLVAGRYALSSILGIPATGSKGVPDYKDFSWNVNFGKGKLGKLSTFGILGSSNIDFLGRDVEETDIFSPDDENAYIKSNFGIIGLTHTVQIGERSYFKNTISASFSGNSNDGERIINKGKPQEETIEFSEVDNSEKRLTLSTLFNSKLSPKTTIRTGLTLEVFNTELLLRDRNEQPDTDNDGIPDFFTFGDADNSATLLQPYVQGQFRLTEKLSLNAGLHAQYFSLNRQFALEPRASLSFEVLPQQTITLGYGLHQQIMPLPLLFLNEDVGGQSIRTNKNFDFTRSNHFVLSYTTKIAKNLSAKIEGYYQLIDREGVESFPSSYSTLIEGVDFNFQNDRVSLVNEGTGFNRGVEITLEKPFTKGYYFMVTGSLFESKYQGSDGIERNSPFNNIYILNALAGKEIKVGRTKRNALTIDTRVSTSGGRYYTPIDLRASEQASFEVLQEDLAFSRQNENYFRWDLKLGFKLNHKTKKSSQHWYFDFQNITNRENVFLRRYNRLINQVNEVNQFGFFPDFGYRWQF